MSKAGIQTSKNKKRQLSKDKEDSSINTLRNLSFFPSAEFIKCPVNIGDCRTPWKDFRLYCKYLDLKAQNPNVGEFRIYCNHRYYQRTLKQLIQRGWALKVKTKIVRLKAYQHVWRDMGIVRINRDGIPRFQYWKIPTNIFADDRQTYLRQIEEEIRKRIAQRKRAQIRHALKKGDDKHQVTFAAKSASLLFGFRSCSTGSKLRQKYFDVLKQSDQESKPYFDQKEMRYKNQTKKIAL